VIGLSPAQLPAFCAGDGSVLNEVSFQQVTRPDSSAKVTIRGSVRVIVYSIGGASELWDLTAVSPVATGTAQQVAIRNLRFRIKPIGR
jgi:hypothetical protein